MRVIREQRDVLVYRLRIFTVAMAALLMAVAVGFWSVQVVHGASYRSLAENNRLRKLPSRAPRGLIYDRHGRLLVENVPSYNLMLDRSRAEDAPGSLEFASSITQRPLPELSRQLQRSSAVPLFKPVLLARRLSLSEVARFGVLSLEHPEFEIDVEHLRLYRHGGQTGHVLGYLGQISEAELAQSAQGVSAQALVGREGVELVYDDLLRGKDGERIATVDSRGKVLEEMAYHAAKPGQNLRLTIDLALQQEAEHQLRGRVGAVVALDPRNGEILALYSSPSINSNDFVQGLSPEEWNLLKSAPNDPLQNRVVRSAQPPGSVFKIVMAVAGLAEGMLRPSDKVWCDGSTTLYNHRFHCWKPGGHGWVDLEDAIRGSCNVYFYQLGYKLGIERIAQYAKMFGFGSVTGSDVRGEKPGLVPDPLWSLRTRETRWYPGETISVSIGQGALSTTPLQLARMMAAVSNGGFLVKPHLRYGAEAHAEPLPLDQRHIRTLLEALQAVVNDPTGTAYGHGRLAGLKIAGKTGTAQVVGRDAWRESVEETPIDQRDHAWFASFAPVDDPRLVVVVFIEHGGKGSEAAAPVARALYETHFQADRPL